MQNYDTNEILREIYETCYNNKGSTILVKKHRDIIFQIANFIS